jgi:hypothetical protein
MFLFYTASVSGQRNGLGQKEFLSQERTWQLIEAAGVERAVFPIPVGDDVATCCDMTRSATAKRAAVVDDQGTIAVLQRDHILVHHDDLSRHSFADAIRGGTGRTRHGCSGRLRGRGGGRDFGNAVTVWHKRPVSPRTAVRVVLADDVAALRAHGFGGLRGLRGLGAGLAGYEACREQYAGTNRDCEVFLHSFLSQIKPLRK